MIIYWYPLFLGILCSFCIIYGQIKKSKSIVIFFSLFPAFFASPFISFTRGAAGAITATDFTGVALICCLFFFPRNWRSPSSVATVKALKVFFLVFLITIWTSGFLYNLTGIENESLQYVRFKNTWALPILMSGFRTFKLITFFSYCVYFYILFFDEKNVKWIINTIIIGSVILAVAQILTRFDIIDLALSYGDTHGYVGPRIMGLTKASVGRIIAIGMVLCLIVISNYKKTFGIISLIILTGGLMLSGSRGGMVIIIVAFVPIILLGKLRGFFLGGIGVLIIVISAVCFLSNNEMMLERLTGSFDNKTITTASSRLTIWTQTASALFEKPQIILCGVGGFNFAYAGLKVNFEHAHNDFLTTLCELGFVGFFVFVSFLFSMAWLLYRNIKTSDGHEKWTNICVFSVFLGLMVASQFESTFYPSISTIPMLRIVFPIFIVISLFSYKRKAML